jgi:hypothetical protein
MPSTSKRQHNLMAMVANNPAAAKRVGIPQSVGQEFMKADKGKRFGSGSRASMQAINRPKTNQGKQEFFSKGGDMKQAKTAKMANGGMTTAKMGAVKTAAPSKDGIASKGKTKGTMVKMGAAKPLGMKRGGKC